MTRLEAHNILLNHFLKNNSFEWYEENPLFENIKFHDAMAIMAALDNFVEKEFLSKTSHDGKSVWILNKPFNGQTQKVEISYDTALLISEIVNYLCDKIDVKQDKCDSMNIVEKDFRNLLYASKYFLVRLENLEKEKSAEGGAFAE